MALAINLPKTKEPHEEAPPPPLFVPEGNRNKPESIFVAFTTGRGKLERSAWKAAEFLNNMSKCASQKAVPKHEWPQSSSNSLLLRSCGHYSSENIQSCSWNNRAQLWSELPWIHQNESVFVSLWIRRRSAAAAAANYTSDSPCWQNASHLAESSKSHLQVNGVTWKLETCWSFLLVSIKHIMSSKEPPTLFHLTFS